MDTGFKAERDVDTQKVKIDCKGVQVCYGTNHALRGVYRDNVIGKLGPTEFRVLTTFLEKPGRVWSRELLLDRVWGRDLNVDQRTVDVHIGRLRKALCQFGHKGPIRTVRGAGYALG